MVYRREHSIGIDWSDTGVFEGIVEWISRVLKTIDLNSYRNSRNRKTIDAEKAYKIVTRLDYSTLIPD